MWSVIKFFFKKYWKTILIVLGILMFFVFFGVSIKKNVQIKQYKSEIKILEQQLKIKDSLITRLAGMEGINLQIKVDVKATNVLGKLDISEIAPKLESFLIYSKQEMLNIQDSIKNQKLINKNNK
jgi:uncharacterized membrane protein